VGGAEVVDRSSGKIKEMDGDCSTRERRDMGRAEETVWEMQRGK